MNIYKLPDNSYIDLESITRISEVSLLSDWYINIDCKLHQNPLMVKLFEYGWGDKKSGKLEAEKLRITLINAWKGIK